MDYQNKQCKPHCLMYQLQAHYSIFQKPKTGRRKSSALTRRFQVASADTLKTIDCNLLVKLGCLISADKVAETFLEIGVIASWKSSVEVPFEQGFAAATTFEKESASCSTMPGRGKRQSRSCSWQNSKGETFWPERSLSSNPGCAGAACRSWRSSEKFWGNSTPRSRRLPSLREWLHESSTGTVAGNL